MVCSAGDLNFKHPVGERKAGPTPAQGLGTMRYAAIKRGNEND